MCPSAGPAHEASVGVPDRSEPWPAGIEPDVSVSGVGALPAVSRRVAVGLLRLAYLAPDIVQAILAGREPQGLTVNRLMKQVPLPTRGAEQRQALGFG